MASRLNFPHDTFLQLVRFALVGFFLAGVYSAVYLAANYVVIPVVAVVIAFLVSVSIGFVMHSRWSFRGHGRQEDHKLKIKFVAVQFFGFLLNELFTWVLTGPLVHGPIWWPLIPAIFVTPLATFALNRQLVFR
jgi:putative flippase GtrA